MTASLRRSLTSLRSLGRLAYTRCTHSVLPAPVSRNQAAFAGSKIRMDSPILKLVVGRKAWMFYGTDTHAEAAAAIFSIIASCRLHGIDPFVYFDEVLRVLPYWPHDRYLELAPQHWLASRAQIDPSELVPPLSHITVPPPPASTAD